MSIAADFFASLKSAAISLYHSTGILPSISLSQAALESGYGSSSLATNSFNLFGIKGVGTAGSTTLPTAEYVNGQKVTVNAAFRKYGSWSESLADYGKLLTENKRYLAVVSASDYETATEALQAAGYATDPNYAAKLRNIIDTYQLYDIDTEAATGSPAPKSFRQNFAERWAGEITAPDTVYESGFTWEKLSQNLLKYAAVLVGIVLAGNICELKSTRRIFIICPP